MPSNRICHWPPVLLGLTAATSQASAADSGHTDYAAGVLMLLGLLAIFLGVRNLRALRHRQPLPRHRNLRVGPSRPASRSATRQSGDV